VSVLCEHGNNFSRFLKRWEMFSSAEHLSVTQERLGELHDRVGTIPASESVAPHSDLGSNKDCPKCSFFMLHLSPNCMKQDQEHFLSHPLHLLIH
jgi:hypothetical protein